MARALARNRLGLDDAEMLADKNAQLQQALNSSSGQTKNLEAKLAKFGGGIDKKPCWADSNGKLQSIFDVALTTGGIEIRDNQVPARVDDEKLLPLGDITFGKEISDETFDNQTERLFDWSQSHDCRFYVRVYDLTGADEKELYKQRLRTVEGHFYKLTMSNSAGWKPKGVPPVSTP